MTPATWPCPAPDGSERAEYALVCDAGRPHRLLIIPALFDEGGKLRRLTVETMRRLDGAGIDSFLPDLPGTNESLAPLEAQTLDGWTGAVMAAINHFRASHVLALRGGGLVLPRMVPVWHYAPVKGAALLRQLLRARIVATRELGDEETQDSLLAKGLADGIELGGYALGAAMVRQLQDRTPAARPGSTVIEHEDIGGPPLWLRAEAGEDPMQADGLAAIIAMKLH